MPRWNIQVSVDSKGVVTGANVAGQATEKMGGKMRRADKAIGGLNRRLKAFGALLGGAIILRGFRGFVDALSEQDTAVRRLESRLRGLGPAALASSAAFQQMASNLQRATGIGDEEILRLQSTLLTFRRIGPEIFGELTETILDVATVMGTDAKSAALQLGKALDDPARRTSELSRAGITFTKVQQDMIVALQESGDLLGAQKMVMAEVRAQYGNAARDEGESLRKKLDELGNSWSDLQQQFGASSGANNPLVFFIIQGIEALRGATDFLKNFELQWAGFIISVNRGAHSLLNLQLRLAELVPGNQNESGLREMMRIIGEDMIPLTARYAKLLGELSQELDGADPKLAGFGNAGASAAPGVEKVAEAVDVLGQKLAIVNAELAILKINQDILDSIDAGLGNLPGQGEGDAIPFDFPEVADSFYDEFLGDAHLAEVTKSFNEALKKSANQFGVEIGQSLASAVASAITRVFRGGDVETAISDFGANIASAFGGPVVGAIAGISLDKFLGVGDTPHVVRTFEGSVKLFGQGADDIHRAGKTFESAVRGLRGTFTEIGQILGGELIADLEFGFTQFGEEITAGILSAGLPTGITGTGGSASEALANALDEFARNFPEIVAGLMTGETGELDADGVPILGQLSGLDLSGLDQTFVDALLEMSFIDWADLVSSLTLWNEAMNSVTNTLGAWTPATDSAMQRIEAMRLEIERSGLSAAAAAPFLAELAQSAAILTEQARAGFFSGIADVMAQMGMNEQQVANFRARAGQIEFQLTVAKLKIEAAALGFVGQFWTNLFAQFDAWAGNISNFVAATANIVAPVIRAAPSVARNLGNALRDARESLADYLRGLNFTSPGSPTPGKSGLRAALEEARRAAGKGDVDAFKSASDAALTIARQLFGSTAGFDDILDQIKQIGGFDPTVKSDPVVGAINNLGTSIGNHLGQQTVTLTDSLDGSLEINQGIGAALIDRLDNNNDGQIGVREALNKISEDLFEQLDVNRDGFLSLGELSSDSAQKLFDLYDVNRDGFLSVQELSQPKNLPLTGGKFREINKHHTDIVTGRIDGMSTTLSRQMAENTDELLRALNRNTEAILAN